MASGTIKGNEVTGSAISFVSTITAPHNIIRKKDGRCQADFEFSVSGDYFGNVQIGTLPSGFTARNAYSTNAVWVANNTIASIYVTGDKVYMQANAVIPANTAIRGSVSWFV